MMKSAYCDGITKRNHLYWVLLLCLLWCTTNDASWTCLNKCICTNIAANAETTQVTCVEANWTAIISSLPPTVTSLDVSQSRLATLAPPLPPTLLHLRLRSSALHAVADDTFASASLLLTLDLANNRLVSLTEHSMYGLSNLETLDLSDNALTFVEGAFKGMSNLNRLDLRNNSITALTRFTLRDLVRLQYLLLGGNRISTVDRDTFRGLDRLIYVVLRGNPLGAVERIDIGAPSLAYVDLSECNLQTLPQGLPPSIRYLQLRRNNMTSLSKTTFIGCPYVGILILDNNNLTTIENKTFSHMTHLQQLWLNNNQLAAVPKILPSSLQRLYLDNNRVSTLTNAFPSNLQIDTLSVMGNRIQEVTNLALAQLPKLRSLDLGNNRITQLHGNTFSECSHLTKLVLSKNPLQTFHQHSLHGMPSLHSLAIAHITDEPVLPPEFFENMYQLRSLDLTNSPDLIRVFLQTVAKQAEVSKSNPATMVALEDLSLLGSQLTHLMQGTFSVFPTLQALQLSSTRFHCDVSMMWLRDWLRETRVRVNDRLSIVCHSPRRLSLRPIAALADNEFAAITSPRTRVTIVSEQTSDNQDILSSADHSSGSGAGTVSNYHDNIISDDIVYDNTDLAKFKKAYVDMPTNSSMPHSHGNINIEINNRREQDDNIDSKSENWGVRSPGNTLYSDFTSETENVEVMTLSMSTTIAALAGAMTVSVAIILIIIILRLSRRQPIAKQLANSDHQSIGSTTPSVKLSKPSKRENRSSGNDYILTPCQQSSSSAPPVKEASAAMPLLDNSIALVPARDINHEGPLVVYKWEEF